MKYQSNTKCAPRIETVSNPSVGSDGSVTVSVAASKAAWPWGKFVYPT